MEYVSKSLHSDIFAQWEDSTSSVATLSSEDKDLVLELLDGSQNRPISCSDQDQAKATTKLLQPPSNIEYHNEIDLPWDQIKSSQQFLGWYASIELQLQKEEDGPNYEYVEQLEKHKAECQKLLLLLEEALNKLEDLSTQYNTVSSKTSALHADCEHLLAEQTQLSSVADVIQNRLSYYEELDKIGQKLRSPAFQVTSDEFIPLLSKMDECINYMHSNPSYLESSTYLAKYEQYLGRALTMVKSYVTKSLYNATQAVTPRAGSGSQNSENSLLLCYQKFKTNAPRMKTLMMEIENRSASCRGYEDLLADCHQFYFTQRKQILKACVDESINDLTKTYARDYCSFIRSGCAFLVHVCEDEYSLYSQFFSSSTPQLNEFLQEICSILYDIARPAIIHIDHLETLSELCNILKRGLIEEHIMSNPTQLAALTTVVEQLLEDCQERLVYRAHIYIQTDISNFLPSPGDLAYPSKLEMMESIAETLAAQRKASTHSRNDSVSSMTSVRTTPSEDGSVQFADRVSRIGNSPADLHGMWYPSVRRTLLCLSKVYRCVNESIFQGVCLEALAACMYSLSTAATSISQTSTLIDAHLFEIKHLLILREQLAPFQIDASLRSLTLDWTKLKDAAYGLIEKRSKMFTLTSNNALLEFIVKGTPQVTQEIQDSKRDVDNNLKRICEQFICSCSERIVGGITAFQAKCETVLTPNSTKKLRDQPFASPKLVAEIVSTAHKNIRSQVPPILRSLELYLSNQDTEFIIFKPIRNNVTGSFTWIYKLVQKQYDEEDQIIIGCPSPEEISAQITLLCTKRVKGNSSPDKN